MGITGGLAVAAVVVAALVTGAVLPAGRVFAPVLAGLVGGLAVLAVARRGRVGRVGAGLGVAGLALAGVAGCVAATVWYLAEYPSTDHGFPSTTSATLPPVMAVVLAVVLAGGAWLAVTPPRWLAGDRRGRRVGVAMALVLAAGFVLSSRLALRGVAGLDAGMMGYVLLVCRVRVARSRRRAPRAEQGRTSSLAGGEAGRVGQGRPPGPARPPPDAQLPQPRGHGVRGRPGAEPFQQVEGGEQVVLGGAVGQRQRLLVGAAERPPGRGRRRPGPLQVAGLGGQLPGLVQGRPGVGVAPPCPQPAEHGQGHDAGGRHRHSLGGHPAADEDQQVQGGLVGPVGVLDHRHHRPATGVEQVQERAEQAVPGRLGGDKGRQLPAGLAGDVEQRAERARGPQRVAGPQRTRASPPWRLRKALTSEVLPIPASPPTSTRQPRPSLASASHPSSDPRNVPRSSSTMAGS